MIAGTRHDHLASSDYSALHNVQIKTARDAVRWHLVDKGGGQFDFSSFLPMLRAANGAGIQVIWNLCHYGWPDGLDLFSPAFVIRFAKFAEATARLIREESDTPLYVAPINEISFFSWAVGQDIMFPFATGRDNEVKKQLVRAGVAAAEAILDVDQTARLMWGDPVVHVLPPLDSPHGSQFSLEAIAYNEAQFEAWDMLAGRTDPALGGAEKYLDIVGVNYYHSNQWEHTKGRLRWEDEPRDPRWLPFHVLLARVAARYNRPIYVAETSHFGDGRARWIVEIAQEVYTARMNGVPVEGICLFPILDRYDWLDQNHWHNSGLWDVDPARGFQRTLNQSYLQGLQKAQKLLATIGCR